MSEYKNLWVVTSWKSPLWCHRAELELRWNHAIALGHRAWIINAELSRKASFSAAVVSLWNRGRWCEHLSWNSRINPKRGNSTGNVYLLARECLWFLDKLLCYSELVALGSGKQNRNITSSYETDSTLKFSKRPPKWQERTTIISLSCSSLETPVSAFSFI